ncbi:MAG TPA: hypothetical protein PKU91_09165, partial [Phycisphaerales bacterium]|nr:hypothetical protein [Phycisphaerales bacterium]
MALGPVRLDVGRLERGEIVARASAWLDRSTLEQAWENDLAAFDAAMGHLVRAVGVSPGSRAIIEYSGPETVVDVFAVNADSDARSEAMKLLGDAS